MSPPPPQIPTLIHHFTYKYFITFIHPNPKLIEHLHNHQPKLQTAQFHTQNSSPLFLNHPRSSIAHTFHGESLERGSRSIGREEEETVRTLAWIPLHRFLFPRSLRPHGIIHSPIEKGINSHSHPHSASHKPNPNFYLFPSHPRRCCGSSHLNVVLRLLLQTSPLSFYRAAPFCIADKCAFNRTSIPENTLILESYKDRELDGYPEERPIKELGSLPPFLLVFAGHVWPIEHRWNQDLSRLKVEREKWKRKLKEKVQNFSRFGFGRGS
ncbi:galacturonosyltransferase-like 5 [Vigna angularis]|uniref:Galacturonosyltransferase-like 5 n=1 Tax=Phaseolus angularis TaxID=3914 RepID=A0A8T0JUX7_PHAAN|nr:galacturonosyltransferase-like 5 [Vigna angularis]